MYLSSERQFYQVFIIFYFTRIFCILLNLLCYYRQHASFINKFLVIFCLTYPRYPPKYYRKIG